MTTFPEEKRSLTQFVGPAVLAIGLGIGSGEFVLWPFLTSKYGYGILWAALLGVLFQVILNTEIQRYTTVTGKTLTDSLLSKSRLWGIWFILSTLFGFGWPAFSAGSGYLLSTLMYNNPTSEQSTIFAVIILLVSGLILLLGKNVYHTIEGVIKTFVPLSFVAILIIFLNFIDFTSLTNLLKGLVGIGDGYYLFPKGLELPILLGAFAYSGSGGNLLLGQSYYVIDKRIGMVTIANGEPNNTEESRKNFRKVRIFQIFENFAVFGGIGVLTIVMLGFLGGTLLQTSAQTHSMSFIPQIAGQISGKMGQFWGITFILSGAIALFSVQMGVLDLLGRLSTSILKKERRSKLPQYKIYKVVVAITVVIGLLVFSLGLREPLWLLTTGAVFNALAMSVITFATLILSVKELKQFYAPSILNKVILGIIGSVYAIFFIITIIDLI